MLPTESRSDRPRSAWRSSFRAAVSGEMLVGFSPRRPAVPEAPRGCAGGGVKNTAMLTGYTNPVVESRNVVNEVACGSNVRLTERFRQAPRSAR